MATQTKQLLYADGGDLVITYDYDDVLLRILSITAVNISTRTYSAVVRSTSTNKTYNIAIPIGTTTQTIPPGASNRLDLTVTPSGKMDGVEWSIF